MPSSDTILHVLPLLAFARLTIGAYLSFVPDASARRDVRTSLIGLSFWATYASSYRAPRGPLAAVVAGLAGLAGSLMLFQWASRSIRGRSFSWVFSTIVPQFLHTSGPYAYIRNPFYASYLLALFATAAIWPSPLTGVIAVAMAFYFQMAARFEERKFEGSPLSADYQTYKGRTGRLVPRWHR